MSINNIVCNNNAILDPEKRFAFGKNWLNFIQNLTEEQIVEAENSLKIKLNCNDLNKQVFLDIGSGSGLFSLAAHRLGAIVYSFDYDQDSVECTKYLKQKYSNSSNLWTIESGSVLDQEFLKKFGKVDIVYSWGVLHHTGNMYGALANVAELVQPGGKLFISIYNDQGRASKFWTWIKKTYNNSSIIIKTILCCFTLFVCWFFKFVIDFLRCGNPFKSWMNYSKNNRGMSAWHDVVDWTGGYPFEVAEPEQIFDFFRVKNFELLHLKTCAGGLGCNEFVFVKKLNV